MTAYHIPRLSLVFSFIVCSAQVQARCIDSVALASALEGLVEVRYVGQQTWQPVSADEYFCPGDTVKVGSNSRAALVLADHTLLRLGASSTVTITGPEADKGFLVKLLEGLGHFMSRVPRTLEVDTPFVNAGVEGTEFLVRVGTEETFVSVFEGKVAMENAAGRTLLVNGQSGEAKSGIAPIQQLVAHPRDAVQWTLYYPMVLSGQEIAKQAGEQSVVTQALALQADGNAHKALSLLQNQAGSDTGLLTLRATLSLSVGQVEQARHDIDQLLSVDANNGNALAMKSIILLVQGEESQALQFAQAAVAMKPDSAAANLALSYAMQSAFQLAQARQVMESAVGNTPDNPLIWSRLAELHLMFRDIEQADIAAQRAIAISPNNAHAHMVKGYVQLIAMDTSRAKQAFNLAIQLDPSAPLSQLGLGLALIREGKLAQGRRAIEVAAILDPGNALIRSYLGKAYFEERRDRLASDQFVMAKSLDPQDPTAYFYDSIYKLANNQPVEALTEMQEAIEKNDNRGVYRSRLMLDEDLATRSVSLARAYNTLGFDSLARIEAVNSLNYDPANYSAHRFLSDSYRGAAKYEIAQSSELLKSQLMQPLNISPLPPQATENDLAVIERAGVGDAAYHEYHPLFMRDDTALQASIFVGGNSTKGNEMILSGIKGKFAYSAGKYHYQSEGFRDNNDLEHDIYNLFGQWAVTPRFNVQAEYRIRETESGDLTLRFDPNEFNPNLRKQYQRETSRVGFHYRPQANHHLIGSAVHQAFDDVEVKSVITDLSYLDPLFPDFNLIGITFVDDYEEQQVGDATQGELQYLVAHERYSVTAGMGSLRHDYKLVRRNLQTYMVPDSRPVPPDFNPNVTQLISTEFVDLSSDYRNAYFYLNSKHWKNQVWTFGGSYDVFTYVGEETKKFNPKVGVDWQVTSNTKIRSAWFNTVRRPYTSNQTIEPTQVAGFNQFFDELSGSLSERYGAAIDHHFSSQVHMGVSYIKVKSKQPMFLVGTSSITFVEPNMWDENIQEAYLFWMANNRLAVSSRIRYDQIEQSKQVFFNLSTLSVPIEVSYFGASGFFVSTTASYVEQRVVALAGSGERKEEHFVNVDMSLGYKLPNRNGIARISVKNLFDREFNYQDDNFTPYEPLSPQYQPERVILTEWKLTF